MALPEQLSLDYQKRRLTLEQTHQKELRALGQTHRTNIDDLSQQHSADVQHERLKVKAAEEDMRMSVDYFQALQDDELRNRFYKLSIEVENLSRLPPASDFIYRVKMMGIDIPSLDVLPGRDQKLLLQSILWTVIVNGIFRTPFQVFGTYGDSVFQTWTTLFSHDLDLDWPKPQLLAEKWRYTTTERLKRLLDSSNTPQAQYQQARASYQSNISSLIASLAGLFSSHSKTNNAQGLSARLHDLLDQASRFAILISSERCRVRVFLPSGLGARSRRESKDVKDVYPGNETEMPYGTAEFVVAPGLSKEGNSRGGKLEERDVLSKAVVYFSLDSTGGVS